MSYGFRPSEIYQDQPMNGNLPPSANTDVNQSRFTNNYPINQKTFASSNNGTTYASQRLSDGITSAAYQPFQLSNHMTNNSYQKREDQMQNAHSMAKILQNPHHSKYSYSTDNSRYEPHEEEMKPALPPKIPVISTSFSSDTVNQLVNNNDPFLDGFHQSSHNSVSSDDNSSVEDLIDRYMETSLLESSSQDNGKKIMRQMTQYRKEKRMRPSSMVEELERDSPPPYEELDHSVEAGYSLNSEILTSSSRAVRRAPQRTDMDTSAPISCKSLSRESIGSHSSNALSVSSLPYPIDDPLISVLDKQLPQNKSRRYTDDLLEELENANKQKTVLVDPPQVRNSNMVVNVTKTDPIQDFSKARNDAILDYKNFTLGIQFKWAKTLIDSIGEPEIVNKYNINGQSIKTLKSSKEIKKNKAAFLSASMKVLKRLSDKLNSAESQALLGDLYTGAILPELSSQDFQKGFEYYLKATKQKHPNATYKLGCCVEHGMGTKKGIEKCFYFYEKSALLGDPDGMCKLGIVFIKGLLGQKKSAEKSIYWLNKAILTRNIAVLPIYVLAKIHETDTGSLNLKPQKSQEDANVIKELKRLEIFHDYKTALRLFLKAAKLGHTKSQSHLGYCYEYGAMNCTVNPSTSIYWYSKAAQKGDANAEMGLSGWYLTGAEEVLQQNDKEAYLWARKASEKGSAKAEYAVGYFNEVGVGTSKNLNEAKKWYKIAASQGYSKAIKKLENWR